MLGMKLKMSALCIVLKSVDDLKRDVSNNFVTIKSYEKIDSPPGKYESAVISHC